MIGSNILDLRYCVLQAYIEYSRTMLNVFQIFKYLNNIFPSLQEVTFTSPVKRANADISTSFHR